MKISMMRKIGLIGLPSNQFGLKPKTPFEAINPLSLEGVDLYCFALPPKLGAEIACQAHVDGISRRRHISVCIR